MVKIKECILPPNSTKAAQVLSTGTSSSCGASPSCSGSGLYRFQIWSQNTFKSELAGEQMGLATICEKQGEFWVFLLGGLVRFRQSISQSSPLIDGNQMECIWINSLTNHLTSRIFIWNMELRFPNLKCHSLWLYFQVWNLLCIHPVPVSVTAHINLMRQSSAHISLVRFPSPHYVVSQ